MSSRAALADCSSAAMRFCKASSSAGEIPADAFLAASCTLARKSVTAFSAASARSRAWLAVAAISSLRRLSAVSAMPERLHGVVGGGEPLGHAGIARRQFGDRVFDLADALGERVDRFGIRRNLRARIGRRRVADRHQAGQPERDQNQRHGRRAGDTGGKRCHADMDRQAGSSAGGSCCADGGGSGCGGDAASGGGISVAVRSMVGAARFLRRGQTPRLAARLVARLRAFPASCACLPCRSSANWPTRPQEITQMAQRRQSTLGRFQKLDQRRLVRPLGHGDAAGAGAAQRLGDLRRQAKMPHAPAPVR